MLVDDLVTDKLLSLLQREAALLMLMCASLARSCGILRWALFRQWIASAGHQVACLRFGQSRGHCVAAVTLTVCCIAVLVGNELTSMQSSMQTLVTPTEMMCDWPLCLTAIKCLGTSAQSTHQMSTHKCTIKLLLVFTLHKLVTQV